MTHPASDWEHVFDFLNGISNVQILSTKNQYCFIDDIYKLTNKHHKTDNSLSIWGDVILHNHQFTCDFMFEKSYFIFWHKEFDKCHSDWLQYQDALVYYKIRTFGMKSYYNRCNKALWNPDFKELEYFLKSN